MIMSAPAVPKGSNVALPDFPSMNQLSKPRRALVYLAVITLVTVGSLLALGASVLVLGELTGAFSML